MKLKEFVDVLFAEEERREGAESEGELSRTVYISLHHDDGSEIDAPEYERQPVEFVGRAASSKHLVFENREEITFSKAAEDWGAIAFFAFNKTPSKQDRPAKLFELDDRRVVCASEHVAFTKGSLSIVTTFGGDRG